MRSQVLLLSTPPKHPNYRGGNLKVWKWPLYASEVKTVQSFHLGSTIWADFPKQSYLTTIIHFFMLYRPVKSEGQKGHFWPRY